MIPRKTNEPWRSEMKACVWLKDLEPGNAFRRKNGTYRYIVSAARIERYGYVSVYCYNLDGESSGYWMKGDTSVVPIPLPSEYKEEPCTPEMPEPFYMCYVEGGGAPTRKHEASAVGPEAERLAKVTKRVVFVLKAMASVEYVPPTADSGHRWIDFALREEK